MEKDQANSEVKQELFDPVNPIVKLLSLEKPKEFRNLHGPAAASFMIQVAMHSPSSLTFLARLDPTCDIVKPKTLYELIANNSKSISRSTTSR